MALSPADTEQDYSASLLESTAVDVIQEIVAFFSVKRFEKNILDL